MSALTAWVVVVVAAVAATGGAVLAALASQRSAVVATRLVPLAEPGGPPAWFVQVVAQAGLHVAPARAWAATRTAATVLGAVAALRWPHLVVGVVAAGVVAWRAGQRAGHRRARRTYDTDLVRVLDGVVAHLTAEASITGALAEAAAHPSPVGLDLDGVLRRHRHGQGLQAALDHWAVQRDTPGVRLVVDSLAIAGQSGGSQRGALLGAQATLREREALQREVRALSSQARASGVVLAVLPAAFALFVAVVDTRVAAFLSSPVGWACLAGGVALNAIGALWMVRLGEAPA